MKDAKVVIDTDSITELDAEVARQLVKQGGDIKLPNLKAMSAQAARELAHFAGNELDLGRCKLSDEAAKLLIPLAHKILIGFHQEGADGTEN